MSEQQHERFVEGLREIDTMLQQRRPSAQGRDALLNRLVHEAEHLDRKRQQRQLAAAGVAAVAVALTAASLWSGPSAPTTPAPSVALGPAASQGFVPRASAARACQGAVRDDGVAIEAGCQLAWSASRAEVAVAEDAVLEAKPGRVMRLVRGVVELDVDHERPRDQVVTVVVSGGRIEVIGTKFTVVERGTRGSVTLHRGTIHFVDDQGHRTRMKPGDVHRWGEAQRASDDDSGEPMAFAPDDVAPAPPVHEKRSRGKRPRKRRASRSSVRPALSSAQLHKINNLRRAGRYDAAIRELRRIEKLARDDHAREVLSFEIGDILTRHRSTRSACRHWRRHLKRFKRGTYARSIATIRADLGCR